MLKLIIGVDVTNILCLDFTCIDPKSTKKCSQVINFFALLGSLSIKTVRKILKKLTTGLHHVTVTEGLPAHLHVTAMIFIVQIDHRNFVTMTIGSDHHALLCHVGLGEEPAQGIF